MVITERPRRKTKAEKEAEEIERIEDLEAQRDVSARIDEILEKTGPAAEERRLVKKAKIEEQVAALLETKAVYEQTRVHGTSQRTGSYIDFPVNRKVTPWVEYPQAGKPPIEIRLYEDPDAVGYKVAEVRRVFIMGRNIDGDPLPKPLFHVGVSDKGEFYVSHNSERRLKTIDSMLRRVSRSLPDMPTEQATLYTSTEVQRPIGTILTHVLQDQEEGFYAANFAEAGFNPQQ